MLNLWLGHSDVRHSQGQITLLDQEYSQDWRPGCVLYLTGDVLHEEVKLWVQGVSWNPATGQTTLSVGYPQHLGISERLALQRYVSLCMYLGLWSLTQLL